MSSARLLGIDGLRGIAVLAVVACHCVLRGGYPVAELGPLVVLTRGWMGVDLFFVISGFLITRLIIGEERVDHRFNLRAFYARRSLRILPPFYVVLLLNLFLIGNAAASSAETWQTLWESSPLESMSLFVFLMNYTSTQFIIALPLAYQVSWSLCVEEHFYVGWSLLLYGVRSQRTRVIAATLLVLAIPVARWAVALGHDIPAVAIQFGSHFRIDSILWGALGALVLHELCGRVRLRRVAGAGAAVVVVALAVAFPADVVPLAPIALALTYSALSLLALCVIVEVVAAPAAGLTRCLEFPPLRFVGRVSYGVYLLHPTAIDLANWGIFRVFAHPSLLHVALQIVLASFFSVGMAALLFAALERPLTAWKERRFPRRGLGPS